MCVWCPMTCPSACAASRSQFEAGKTTTADFMRSLFLCGDRNGFVRGRHQTLRFRVRLVLLAHDFLNNGRRLGNKFLSDRAAEKRPKVFQFLEREMPRHDMR